MKLLIRLVMYSGNMTVA